MRGPRAAEPAAVPRVRAARPGPQRFLRRSVVESDQEELPGLEAAEGAEAQPPQPLQQQGAAGKTRRLIAERARRSPGCPGGPPPAAPPSTLPTPAWSRRERSESRAWTSRPAPVPPTAVPERRQRPRGRRTRGAPRPGRAQGARREEPERRKTTRTTEGRATSPDGRFLKFDIELGRGSSRLSIRGWIRRPGGGGLSELQVRDALAAGGGGAACMPCLA